ncbi:MAG: DUF1292 domain-containing protein [Halanaerobiales bacterium]
MTDEGKFWIDEAEGELVIADNDGGEDRYVIEKELTLDNTRYLILVPSEEIDNQDAEAFVLKLTKDGEEEVLAVIEDDEEFAKVKKAYAEA